ncbi:MAG: acetyl-CoA carboxylase biotin carboxyl carrier protein subunit [Ruminiclostridium sp.]|nr:acetyl-CoA carboxylase biotin carboxyl carrier protein subunit [Ruminiclostridium sp.]
MKRYNITVNGTAYDVTVEETDASAAPVAAAAPAPAPKKAAAPKAVPAGGAGNVKIEAPMPGTVMDVKLKVGDKVTNGTPIVIIEAMKMENEIPATCDGTIASINVNKGDSVNTGTLIATINA